MALTALLVGPWWSQIPEASIVPAATFVHPSALAPLAPAVTPSPASARLDAATRAAVAHRPAHLNLDVRHSFRNVDLSVTVDGKTALTTQLDGSGKRFKVFGKRAERGYTQTLDLAPGVRVVRIRMKSAADRFDQTRVERFDLAATSVATISIAADKSGLSLIAKHPPRPSASVASAPAPTVMTVQPATPVATAAAVPAVPAVPIKTSAESAASPVESALVELVHSLRSMLIAIAGFVASAATGFVVQEFLRRRRSLLFAESEQPARAVPTAERRRRKRANA